VSQAVGRDYERSRALAFRTLLFGLLSPVLLLAGLGLIPFAWELGALAAVVSIVYGVRTVRRPRGRRSTALATTGICLASITLLLFLWISIAFVLDPPE
jgi:hypothetical protein